ncbi:MAG: fibronectin/fibrinogen-binding protein [bacterium]|nr:fibronectin/fibrinogen-binding protein [bacterium]
MDTLILNAITQELQARICPSRINNIFQPEEYSPVFVLWSQRREVRLAFSLDARFQYIYLTQQLPGNQLSGFGKFLLHHIKGAEIRAITKPPLERILTFELVKKDIDGSDLRFQLILEIMGRHSNLILIQQESGKILESLRHVTAAQSSYRRIAPGAVYVPPPLQDKLNPTKIENSAFRQILQQYREEAQQNPKLQLWKFLLQCVQGLSPLLAKEIAGKNTKAGDESCWERFVNIRDAVSSATYQPTLILQAPGTAQEKALALSAVPLKQFSRQEDAETHAFESMSAAAEAYYTHLVDRQLSESLRNALLSPLKHRLAKLQKKREHLREQQEQILHAEEYKQKGELIAANIYQLEKGMRSAEAIDYYHPDQAQIEIELDPRLNPSQNAQRWFKRYNKLKQGEKVTKQRLAETERDIAYLEELQFFVEDAKNLGELRRLKEETQVKQAAKKQTTGRQKPGRQEPAKPFLRFVSSDGFEIYVGRSSRENDLLTQKNAQPEDIWLHAHQAPGSHVLILNRERKTEIPERTLQEAASLAAFHSKLRRSGKVDVIYSPRKHVKKPKGAPPGLVTLSQFQTIRVIPQAEISRNTVQEGT